MRYAFTFCSECKDYTVHEGDSVIPYSCIRHSGNEVKEWDSKLTLLEHMVAGMSFFEVLEMAKKVVVPRLDYLANQMEMKADKQSLINLMAAEWPRTA